MGNSIIEQLMILHLEARIIHRDIKPSNLMVCQQQNLVKIIDFGLSAYLKTDGESGNTSQMQSPTITEGCDNEIVGTKLFGSIKQNRGLRVGKKDDLESALLCFLRLVLKTLGIKEIPWRSDAQKCNKVNHMISLKVELQNFQFIWNFVKDKIDLSEEVDKKKAFIAIAGVVECFKLLKDLKFSDRSDYSKIMVKI